MFGIDHVLSMLEGPELTGRRRKELALVRLMASTMELLLYTDETNLDTRIETARDLIRELKCVYPEVGKL